MKKVVRVIFFLFVIMFVIIRFYSGVQGDYNPTQTDDGDFDVIDTVQQMVTHNRSWKDFDDAERKIGYTLSSMSSMESSNYRNGVNVEYDGVEKVFWRDLYFNLYDHDEKELDNLKDSIVSLATQQHIQTHELPYTVVSFVQDIPYNYIISSDSCAMHDDHPCVPLQRYGILSPIEFLYTLSGDCDTRTVTLFTLLKKLGYDPIIVNSAEYRHSMLALDIPTEGDYFVHKGRKFYFWETTANGWLPGMLPPEMNNIDYWTIILDYEFQTDATRNY